MHGWSHSRLISVTTGFILATQVMAGAGAVSRDELTQWLAQDDTQILKPNPGQVIDASSIESLRPLLPPGYFDDFQFPELTMEIQETAHFLPHASYTRATEQFVGQTTLDVEGGLANYHAGRPFSPAQIVAAPADQGGLMVAWNHIHRWQNYGWFSPILTMHYIHPTPDGRAGQLMPGLEGGGNVDRFIVQSYQRVYLNHVSTLAGDDFRVQVADSDSRFFKEYLEMFEPFDVKGMKFVIERMQNPTEPDQVNSYLPTQRRVRRLSAEERADSFMGSDLTFDDFEGYSGRVLDYTWTYIGEKDVLHVSDSKHEFSKYFGPMSRVPHDRWQLRHCVVVEMKPRWSGHPYASKLMFLDAETYNIVVALVFDHEGQLLKTFDVVYKWPVNYPGPDGDPQFTVPLWQATIGTDRKNNTTTVARSQGTTTPNMEPDAIARKFNVSNLSDGR